MEFVEGLHTTQKKHDSIRVIMDRLTKYVHFVLVKKTNTMEKLSRIYVDK